MSSGHREYYRPTGYRMPTVSVRSATDQAAFSAEVEQFLMDELRAYNSRDVDAIHTHLDTIQDCLEKNIQGTLRLLFGGSIQKHTYVDGLSDVDMLVCVNDSSLASATPAELLEQFGSRLRGRLPSTEIHIGDMAVSVTFSDGHKIQLLPAFRTATGFRVSNTEGQWSQVARPQRFARELTRVNQENGGRVVPVIKLYKALNSSLPRASRLTGYHVEALAIEAFQNYHGRQTVQQMIRHLCSQAIHRVTKPIGDTTGQSLYVDDYLGPSGGNLRQRAANAIRNVLSDLDRAVQTSNSRLWKDKFA